MQGQVQSNQGPAALPIPDTLLLNGGVFRAPALAERLQALLTRWRGAPVRVLTFARLRGSSKSRAITKTMPLSP